MGNDIYCCGGKLSIVVSPCPFAPPRPVRSCHLSKENPDEGIQYGTVAGRGLLEERGSNDFTCSLLVQGYLTFAKEMWKQQAWRKQRRK